MNYKYLASIIFTVLSDIIFGQNCIYLPEVKNVNSELTGIFSEYASEIKNQSKRFVFVQIENCTISDTINLSKPLKNETTIFLRLVSSVENEREVFQYQNFGGMKLIGFVSEGPIDFILYSSLTLKGDFSEWNSEICFDSFDLYGHPIFVWDLIKYSGRLYKSVEY
jgi:hypothetical protein